jgi:hypothetical protein
LTITWAESNPAQLIRRANLASMGKRPKEPDTWEPAIEWAKAMVLAEDSTLEYCSLIIDTDTRGDVASHIVRATAYHPRHVVQSSRPDYTGKARPGPEVPRIYFGKWDIKALLQMAKERLCYRAMKETREEIGAIKLYLLRSDDVLMKAVGWGMMPACVFRCGCNQGERSCGAIGEHGWGIDYDHATDLWYRYDNYNDWFIKSREVGDA